MTMKSKEWIKKDDVMDIIKGKQMIKLKGANDMKNFINKYYDFITIMFLYFIMFLGALTLIRLVYWLLVKDLPPM